MEWHEVVAWVIIAVAATVAIAWCVKRIVCPASSCEGCNKDCSRRQTNNN